MKVQVAWEIGTKYVDRDPNSGRVYLCIHVLDDGRPVFVCNTCVGTQRVETRMPCGCQGYGLQCQDDIVEEHEAATPRRQAAIARQQVAPAGQQAVDPVQAAWTSHRGDKAC